MLQKLGIPQFFFEMEWMKVTSLNGTLEPVLTEALLIANFYFLFEINHDQNYSLQLRYILGTSVLIQEDLRGLVRTGSTGSAAPAKL